MPQILGDLDDHISRRRCCKFVGATNLQNVLVTGSECQISERILALIKSKPLQASEVLRDARLREGTCSLCKAFVDR